jgi:hypothetical protein
MGGAEQQRQDRDTGEQRRRPPFYPASGTIDASGINRASARSAGECA